MIDTISPTVSIWPVTICPPSLELRDKALSRFTKSPDLSSEKFVILNVSSEIFAVNSSFLRSTIVRQTPLTAILSHSFASSKTVFDFIVIVDFVIEEIFPISSIKSGKSGKK